MLNFPREHRLVRAEDFRHTLDRGAKIVTPHFVLLASATEQRARLGLIMTRKVGNAVQRNRLKRQVRERFRAAKESHFGLDLVVIARQRATEVENKQLIESFDQGLERLKGRIQRC